MTSAFNCGDLVDSQDWVKWDANSSVNECPGHHKKNCINVLYNNDHIYTYICSHVTTMNGC